MTVRVYGARVHQFLVDPDGPVGARAARVGVRVQNRARQRCPVDTGRLRSSVVTTRPVTRGAHQVVVRVGTNVRYALFVHEGTRYMRGRPFLREALNEVMR